MKAALILLLGVVLAEARSPHAEPPPHHHQKAKPECVGKCVEGPEAHHMPFVMHLKEEHHKQCVAEHMCPNNQPAILRRTPCENGMSGEYPCNNIDLLAYVSLADMGSNGDGNDIWGWTDPETRREYAIMGMADGTAFVDVTPNEGDQGTVEPKVLGKLPTQTVSSSWRDIKVYKDHAFIVSEASGHGMQVFNLARLRDAKPNKFRSVVTFEPDAHYGQVGNTHNIAINEETGYAYLIGSTRSGSGYTVCRGGPHIVDIREPLEPKFVACYGEDGYTHDAQCVIYHGPDERYHAHEICLAYNENTLTIIDVTDKESIKMLSRVPYENVQYSHQGWLTEDHSFAILNDELDEMYTSVKNTRSLLWDVRNLEEPVNHGQFLSSEQSVDHNLYIKGVLAYESNYCAGLRVLDISEIVHGSVREVAYYDVAPYCNSVSFSGTWSNYPYFASGNIIVSSIERGLYVLRPTFALHNGTRVMTVN